MSSKLFLLLVLCAVVAVQSEAVYIEPCNEVCGRSHPERMQCCRAHGYRRGMFAGHYIDGMAYCIKGDDSSSSSEGR